MSESLHLKLRIFTAIKQRRTKVAGDYINTMKTISILIYIKQLNSINIVAREAVNLKASLVNL